MAEIHPFKGILYNREKVGDLSSVAAPLYDIISLEEQDRYYRVHPYNVIRLILGKESPHDNSTNNRYTRAAAYFENWQKEEVLKPDQALSIYLYEQEYKTRAPEKKRQKGFVALIKLEEFGTGKVLSHEETLAEPKMDRLNLLRACRANFCQIFGLYSDPEHLVNRLLDNQMKNSPLIEIKNEQAVTHRMWRVSDEEIIAQVKEIMSNKLIFIADGHHRYETAIDYRNEMRKLTPGYTGEEPFNYVTMMFVNMDDQELTILPLHRVIKNLPIDFKRLETAIHQFFDVEEFEFSQNDELRQRKIFFEQLETKGTTNHAFGLYRGNNKYYLLTLRDLETAERLMAESHSENWKKLNVVILHSLLIDYGLGLKDDHLEDKIEFITNEDKAIDLVKSGKYRIAFFLNPIKISEVKKIAVSGEKMPQKSTFFYPKPLSGLVMWKMKW